VVAIHEAFPIQAQLDFDNYEPPSIGSWSGRLLASYDNLFGIGDAIGASFTATQGLLRGEAELSAPIGARGGLLRARGRYSTSRIVSEPGNQLDIRAEFFEAGALVSHPLHRTLSSTLSATLLFEWRRSRTFLLDDIPWSFTPGAQDGQTTVSALRLPIEWTWATGRQVLVGRSTFSFGLPILGATLNSGGVEDGVFFSWLLQTQWVRRFDFLNTELVARADVQLAADPLLPIERFSLGGRYSVRGYRQNLFVRDSGLFGSIEARFPLRRHADGSPMVQLAPFLDFGRSWTTGRPVSAANWLAGIGAGVRWFPLHWVYAELYGGYGLVDVPLPPDRDAQDLAIYLRLALTGF
jgi:hemolysin activation/secretion protein